MRSDRCNPEATGSPLTCRSDNRRRPNPGMPPVPPRRTGKSKNSIQEKRISTSLSNNARFRCPTRASQSEKPSLVTTVSRAASDRQSMAPNSGASANGRLIPDEARSPPPSFPGRRGHPRSAPDTRARRQEAGCARRQPNCSGPAPARSNLPAEGPCGA